MNEQRVMVLGGASGIGFDVARQASARGAHVAIVGRDQARLDAAAGRLNGEVQSFVLDAHDDVALKRFFSDLEAVDHLVSMVGDSMAGGFMTTEEETMRHVLHSKFWTNWMIGRLVGLKLRKGGSITFTSGTGGRPQEASATYVANLGIDALVQGLAVELGPRVRVNAVAPTFMDTPFWKHLPEGAFEATQVAMTQAVPLKRLGTVEEVASAYVYLMSNGFITGHVLAVDGGVMLGK